MCFVCLIFAIFLAAIPFLIQRFTNSLHRYEQILQTYPLSARAKFGVARSLDAKAELLQSNKWLANAIEAYVDVLFAPNVPDGIFKAAGERVINRMRFKGGPFRYYFISARIFEWKYRGLWFISFIGSKCWNQITGFSRKRVYIEWIHKFFIICLYNLWTWFNFVVDLKKKMLSFNSLVPKILINKSIGDLRKYWINYNSCPFPI